MAESHNRIHEWDKFYHQVMSHIMEYTIPQYGNPDGNEQIDNFTVEDCFTNVKRYINRRGVSIRGSKETLRDIIKIAHYMCVIYYKMRENLDEPDVYPQLGPTPKTTT